MLTCKRRKQDIYIYDGNKKLGYLYPSFMLDEKWAISTPTDLFFNDAVPFESLFLKAFNQDLDSVPNIRKKMAEAWEIKQAIILANTIGNDTLAYLQRLQRKGDNIG